VRIEEEMTAKKNENTNTENENYKTAIKELMVIPGVGKKIAEDLWNLEIRSVSALKDRDPEKLYQQLCDFQGMHVDRCMLYVFREAVYFASNNEHDPELLKWWNWKD
jgi:recombinational DNA repair protein RecR